jgi:hypothetical protein
VLALLGLFAGCDTAFDPVRQVPKRGSLGQEVFGLVCDRVGAQSLREDVTGGSFRPICHPDSMGRFGDRVDVSRLPELPVEAVDAEGHAVSRADRQAQRTYQVARIEALARRRQDVVRALEAALPDRPITLVDPDATGSAEECARAPRKEGRLYEELAATLGRMVALYDDETVPHVTRALGGLLEALQTDDDALGALARLDARQGYRPLAVAVGTARPILAYPRLPELASELLRLIADGGTARPHFEAMLRVLREELRVPSPAAPPALAITRDPSLDVPVLSRPRTNLELADALMLADHPKFGAGAARYIVRRDDRGVARIAMAGGRVPAPFMDEGQGVPALDALGQFVTTSGQLVPAPFHAAETPTGNRDGAGRALGPSGAPLYEYVDVTHTFLGRLIADLRPLLDPDAARALLPKLVGGLGVLLGEREADPASARRYPADPARKGAPVELKYRAFRAAPLVDLAYAIGRLLSHRDVEDSLALFDHIVRERPAMLARMVDLGLRLKAIADAHPEASLPRESVLWDEMLELFGAMAHTPGVFDGMLRALADPKTRDLGPIIGAYMRHRDEISYDHTADGALNGPAHNLTTGLLVTPAAPLSVPVDRSRPDSRDNRSALQRFLQLLHDTNGLSACTKEGAVAHIDIVWPPGSSIRIQLDYPTNPLVRSVCAFVGATPPRVLPRCGILRFPNVAAMIVDVAVEHAEFDIRDECLKKIMNSPLTGLVGGVDAFLEEISGIEGFNLSPTVAGVARLAFFETPFEDWGGYPGTDLYPKTRDFLKDILDPIPSMACASAPFTDTDGTVLDVRRCDRFEDTLRGRNRNALFPLELKFGETDFVQAIRPLALAFWQAGASPLLIELLDTLHLHWGSRQQAADECDPAAAPGSGRFCTGDGLVHYEPLLAEMMESDLFPVVADLVTELQTIEITHCERWQGAACAETSRRNGVAVLAAAAEGLLDPARNAGLADRAGVPKPTPVHLLVDSLAGMDAAFERRGATRGDGEERQAGWRSVRSQLVDTLLPIDRSSGTPRLANPGFEAILPRLIEVLRAQVAGRCPERGAPCAWAERELAESLAGFTEGPTLAATMDLLEAVRADGRALEETQRFVAYLIDQASEHEALAATLAATVDLVQVLGDAPNLDPVFTLVARATALPEPASMGREATRGLVDGTVGLLWKLFEPGQDDKGRRRCTSAIDPHHAMAVFLRNLVTPMSELEPAPIEVLLSVIADVNRADPRRTGSLSGADFRNVGREMSALLLDRARGLEQLYAVLRDATGGQ